MLKRCFGSWYSFHDTFWKPERDKKKKNAQRFHCFVLVNCFSKYHRRIMMSLSNSSVKYYPQKQSQENNEVYREYSRQDDQLYENFHFDIFLTNFFRGVKKQRSIFSIVPDGYSIFKGKIQNGINTFPNDGKIVFPENGNFS